MAITRKSIRKSTVLRAALVIALGMTLPLSGAVLLAQTGPAVRTGKPGYKAGETVTILGSGFTASEPVTLQVTHADAGRTAEGGMGHELQFKEADATGAGCEQAGCALIGGETAEMPGMYPDGEYDLAGFAVGVVEKSKVIGGQSIVPGDVVLGLASSGVHSNGYSLVRKLIDVSGIGLKSDFHGKPFADVVMAPTRIYVKPLLALMEKMAVKGMAHITGGGITGNLPRCLPENVAARVDQTSWTRLPLFDWLQQAGNVTTDETLHTSNSGYTTPIHMAG